MLYTFSISSYGKCLNNISLQLGSKHKITNILYMYVGNYAKCRYIMYTIIISNKIYNKLYEMRNSRGITNMLYIIYYLHAHAL